MTNSCFLFHTRIIIVCPALFNYSRFKTHASHAGQLKKLTPAPLFPKERGVRWKINKGYVIIQKMKNEIKLIARELRKNQTETEEILWKKLRNRSFLNKIFLRQHPIIFQIEDKECFFIADFFCNEEKLVIEVDGEFILSKINMINSGIY